MKSYKAKWSRHTCEGISRLIDEILQKDAFDSAADRLIHSALCEVKMRIDERLVHIKDLYRFRFSPVQSFAVVVLYEEYVMPFGNHTSFIENQLLQISNQIHQLYTI